MKIETSHRLIEKLENKSATIGILGLGYVGIPLAYAICQAGIKTIGFDIDEKRVADLNNGISPINHITAGMIGSMQDSEFMATADFQHVEACDCLLICVPTPLNEFREPDLSAVTSTMESIQPFLRSGQLVSLESTTWPGTTEEILAPYILDRGFEIGKNFYLVYSPEREDPGNDRYDTKSIPKIVGGVTNACNDIALTLYGLFIDELVPVKNTRTAEMVKLVENIHRSVNIGLVNELKKVAHSMGIDIFDVIDAAATKPFGFTPYYPGPGIGGHCVPIDPFYLTWKAREFGLHTRFIELAGEINAEMPKFVVDKLVFALSQHGKAMKGAKVLCLGIAYKRGVDDMRESPSVIVMELLRDWGVDVAYSDMHVPEFPKMRGHSFDLKSVSLDPATIASFDATILLTDHSEFDYAMIKKYSKIIVDTRGKFRSDDSAAGGKRDNVVDA